MFQVSTPKRPYARHLIPALAGLVALSVAASASAVTFEFHFDEEEGQWTQDQRDAFAFAGDMWSQMLAPTGEDIVLESNVIWDPDHGTAYARASTNYYSDEDVWRARGVHGYNNASDQSIGTIGFSTQRDWYTGLDGQPPDRWDMVTVAMHEIGHLMGMISGYRGWQEWGFAGGDDIVRLRHWDLFMVDDFGNTPEPGDDNDFVVDDPIWFTGDNAQAFHGGPVQVFAPDPDPDEGNPANLAHPNEEGGLMTYGGRSRSQHGLFDYEVGMFMDLGLSFEYPEWMHLSLQWSGSSPHDVWHNGANWDWGLPPREDTKISFHMPEADDEYEMPVVKDTTVDTLWMGGSPEAQARLIVDDELSFTTGDVFLGGEPTSNAFLRVGYQTTFSPGEVRVGFSGEAELELRGQASNDLLVIGSQEDGDGRVYIHAGHPHEPTATWHVDGLLLVGHEGSGELELGRDSYLQAQRLLIAREPGSQGSVIVDGTWQPGPAKLHIDQHVVVGGDTSGPGGHAQLIVDRDSELVAGDAITVHDNASLTVRDEDAAIRAASLTVIGGTARQRDESSILIDGGDSSGYDPDPGLHVGLSTTPATIDIRDAAELTTTDAHIDVWDNSELSLARIRGEHTRWNNDHRIDLGSIGRGDLHILDRARVNSLLVRLGHSGGFGRIIVASPGEGAGPDSEPSYLHNEDSMRIGEYGGGEVLVQHGGKAHTGWLHAGLQDAGFGSVTVTGYELGHDRNPIPSTLNVEEGFLLGVKGAGEIDVEHGAHMLANHGYIAYQGGHGSLDVRDHNSRLEVENFLTVGAQGRGSLTIENNAHADVGGATTIGSDNHGAGILTVDNATLHTGSLIFHPGSVGSFEFPSGDIFVDGGSLTFPGSHLVLDGATDNPPSLRLINGAEGQLDPGHAFISGVNGGGNLHVESGSTFTTYGAIVSQSSYPQNHVVVTDPHSHLHSLDQVRVGAGGEGAVTVANAGKATVDADLLVAHDPDAVGYLVVSGFHDDENADTHGLPSSLNVAGSARVGSRGNGMFQVDNRALAQIAGDMHLGAEAGGQGHLLIGEYLQGQPGVGGGHVEIGGNLHIASDAHNPPQDVGQAQALVSEGGHLVVDGATYLGPEAAQGAAAVLGLQGGRVTTGSLYVRPDGDLFLQDGQLTIDGGTFEHAPAPDDLHVEGATSDDELKLVMRNNAVSSNIQRLDVGHQHHGELEVRTGSTLTTTRGNVGREEDATGDALVTFNATWNATDGPLNVGYRGQGQMRVSTGGSVNAQYTHLGFYQSAHGQATIIGQDASWNVDYAFNVGWAGHGELEVRNGGTLHSDSGRIAGHEDGTGHAVIAGPNSTWYANDLDVGGTSTGAGGDGTLTLENGGRVEVDGSFRIWYDGKLEGDGVVVAPFSTNAGTVSPGTSTGTLEFHGSYINGSLLEIDLAASDDYDRIKVVDGDVNLGGTLSVSLLDGFIPGPGDVFDIVTTNQQRNGEFNNLIGLEINDQLSLEPRYHDQGVSLVVDGLLVGDMNLDGVVDTGDVAPFVLALTDPDAYQGQYDVDEQTMISLGDLNADGAFDTGDVAPFVQLLVGGTPTVPEPSTATALAALALTLLRRRRR